MDDGTYLGAITSRGPLVKACYEGARCVDDGCEFVATIKGRCKRHYNASYKRARNQPWSGACNTCGTGIRKGNQYCAEHSKRAAYMKSRYGVTQEWYEAKLKEQGDACAICKTPKGDEFFCVDHDHACCTGQQSCGKCVRGLLCVNCNWLLGQARDNADTLRAALAYLEGN